MERKEAIEVVKNNWPDSSFTMLREALETLVPELKENEDERIRKELIHYFSNGFEFLSLCSFSREDILAWLEKQDPKKLEEQLDKMIEADLSWLEKPADDKIEPKFKAGDWIVSNLKKDTFFIKIISQGYFILEDTKGGIYFPCLPPTDADYHLWTIADAKDGDVLYSPCLKLLWIFKSRDTVYCGCNLNYNDGAFSGEGYFERPTDAIPATMEQRDTLERAITNAGYRWDKEKLKLEKI